MAEVRRQERLGSTQCWYQPDELADDAPAVRLPFDTAVLCCRGSGDISTAAWAPSRSRWAFAGASPIHRRTDCGSRCAGPQRLADIPTYT